MSALEWGLIIGMALYFAIYNVLLIRRLNNAERRALNKRKE